jgi:Aminopeptidase N
MFKNLNNIISSFMKVKYYDIYLEFEDEYFTGIEKVFIETDEDIKFDCNVKVKNVKNEKGINIKFDLIEEKLVIYTGKYSGEIWITFEGKVSKESLVGVYKAKEIITTQFEPNFASKLFPCIDNPAYKAVFKLAICVKKGLDVISNMPIESVKEKNGKVIYEFKQTPPMSTYLLYVGIGKFEELKKENVIISTLEGKSSRGKFALDLALKCLKFYENYFEIPYELPKLHLIAIPDFLFGAMENWGAITFRESSLLIDENSSLENKKRVITAVSHEIAHQWFGNLVTLKWWDDLWLNESFATFLEFKCAEKIYPQYNILGDFVRSVSRALFIDSLSSTHKIKAEIKTPVDINEAFDEISYEKGAGILRMVESYLGEEEFRKGIISYLNKFKYSNATAYDFFESIKSTFLEDWISKPGYPLIIIDVDRDKILIEQERFSLLKNVEEILYKVPLTLEVNGKTINKIIDKKSDQIILNENIVKIKANVNRTGFYRVFYNDLSLVKNLNDIENAGLIDDYYNFFIAKKISFNGFVNLVKEREKYKGITTSEVISSILSNLSKINPSKYKNLFENYIYEQIKIWEKEENEEGKSLYHKLITRMCFINEDFATNYYKLFYNYENLSSDIKDVAVVAYAAKTSDFETLFKKYSEYTFDEDKERFLNGISAVRDPLVLERFLKSMNSIKYQHLFTLISWFAYNPFIRKEYYSIFMQNLDKFKEIAIKITGGIWGFGMLIRNVFPQLSLVNKNEIEEILDKLEYKELSKDINYTKEMIKINEILFNPD